MRKRGFTGFTVCENTILWYKFQLYNYGKFRVKIKNNNFETKAMCCYPHFGVFAGVQTRGAWPQQTQGALQRGQACQLAQEQSLHVSTYLTLTNYIFCNVLWIWFSWIDSLPRSLRSLSRLEKNSILGYVGGYSPLNWPSRQIKWV
jgi:hypothetical protein